jgi:hypothetical protein
VTGALWVVLTSFIVSNRKDFFALKEAAQAARVQLPNVYTMDFGVLQHSIPASREPPPDVLTVRRVIQVCPPSLASSPAGMNRSSNCDPSIATRDVSHPCTFWYAPHYSSSRSPQTPLHQLHIATPMPCQ